MLYLCTGKYNSIKASTISKLKKVQNVLEFSVSVTSALKMYAV